MASGELDLHLHPKRVEAVALDGVEHGDERGAVRQNVLRHVNGIDRGVVRQEDFRRTIGHFLEVDGEGLSIVEGGHVPSAAIGALGRGLRGGQRCQESNCKSV